MALNEIFDQIRAKENFRGGVPAVEADFARIENRLDISLPDEYRSFLAQFGYARWVGHAILGVYMPDAPPRSFDYDTVRRTMKARAEPLPAGFEPLPLDGNVIDRYDAGGYYFLFSKSSTFAGEVVLIDHEQMGGISQRWASFDAFLRWIAKL